MSGVNADQWGFVLEGSSCNDSLHMELKTPHTPSFISPIPAPKTTHSKGSHLCPQWQREAFQRPQRHVLFFTVLTFNPQEAGDWSVTIQLLVATRSDVKQLACLTNMLLLINEHSSVNEQSCISLRWEVLLYFCKHWCQSCRCTNSPPLAHKIETHW